MTLQRGATGLERRRSSGGLWYGDAGEFEAALDFLFGNPEVARRMARTGAAFTRENYSWDVVLAKYDKLLEEFGNREPGHGT